MKYQRRPETIEAFQFTPGAIIPGAQQDPSGSWYVHTAKGRHTLLKGEYVIGTVPGKQRVMPRFVFESQYEPVAAVKKAAAAKKVAAKKPAKKKVTKKTAAKKK
jgi:hypothetical protein